MSSPFTIGKALVSFVRLVRDPSRLAEVFDLADNLEKSDMLAGVVSELSEDPAARRAFEERPRVGRIDLQALGELPPGTLGREFAEHIRRLGLDLDAIPTLSSDDATGFFRAHLYETHDIWHVVTGFGVDFTGELGLQATYVAQIPGKLAPVILAIGLINLVLYTPETRLEKMDAIAAGYLLGRRARSLFGVRWAEMWEKPLSEVRRELGIVPAPAAGALGRREVSAQVLAGAQALAA